MLLLEGSKLVVEAAAQDLVELYLQPRLLELMIFAGLGVAVENLLRRGSHQNVDQPVSHLVQLLQNVLELVELGYGVGFQHLLANLRARVLFQNDRIRVVTEVKIKQGIVLVLTLALDLVFICQGCECIHESLEVLVSKNLL